MEITLGQKLIKETADEKNHRYYWLYETEICAPEEYVYPIMVEFILSFDIESVMDYCGNEDVCEREVREYANELAWNYIDDFFQFNWDNPTRKQLEESLISFQSYCKNTIEQYNKSK